MKTNSVNPDYSYSGKSRAPKLGSRRGHSNPDNLHSSRRNSKGSGKANPMSKDNDGLMGRAVGVRVPMKMFEAQYQRPDIHAQVPQEDGANFAKMAKKALSNKMQRKMLQK